MDKKDNIDLNSLQIEPVSVILDILRNWWVILLGAVGAAMLMSVVVSERYVPTYTTSATFVVSRKDNANSYSNWAATYEMAQTMQIILKSNTMNAILCDALGVDSIDAQINAETLGSTNFLTLRVTAGSSKEAMTIIRAVMDNYTKVSYYALGNAIMDVLEEPSVPMSPDYSLDVRTDAKKAFLLMGAALTGLFGLLSVLQDTVRTEKEVEQKLDARSLGVIPYTRKRRSLKSILLRKKSALLISHPLAGFSLVESYRKLATKVDYQMKRKGKNAIVVTSVSENEGKSTVAANLAIALAGQSKKVLLIDGDLRRPSQFLIFDKVSNDKHELGEYLRGKVALEQVMVDSSVPNLYLAVGRNCYSSSTEMLEGKALEELMEAAKSIMDYVIIDSPPVGLIGDAQILAKHAGAVMLVAKQHAMFAEDINDVIDELRDDQTQMLGVVLNRVLTFSQIAAWGRYGGYGKYGKYADTKRR